MNAAPDDATPDDADPCRGAEKLHALRARVADRSLSVAVIGLGYVGLPLATRFAEVGFRVVGVDIDEDRVARILRQESFIADVPGDRLADLVSSGRLSATTDFDVLADVDVISICVPTPLSKFREPDLKSVVLVGEQIAAVLRPGHLVVLESTTYPGTTEELLLPVLARSGLQVGVDFFLAFAPERVDPGRVDFTVANTPRVIGGVTAACLEAAATVYQATTDRVVRVSSSRAAEMVKMLENTFRSVNIGLVNEIAIMCDRLDIEVFEVVDAAATKPFGFMPFYPGPGLGGHCLPVDPHYLSWKMRTLDFRARFIELADEVNRQMSDHVVDKIMRALNELGRAVNGARILVLGVAYKRDVDDVRESPALDIMTKLSRLSARVSYHDPHVPSLTDLDMRSVPLADGLLEADCVVIVTDHTRVDYEQVVRRAPLVVDVRNATNGLHHLGTVVTL